MKRVLLVGSIVALVVLGGAALGARLLYRSSFETPMQAGAPQRELLIPEGATGAEVAALLEREKLIRSATAWRVWLRLNPELPSVKAGRHVVSAGWPLPRLHEALSTRPLSEDESFTVVEGWRRVDTDAALAAAGWAEAGAYLSATSSSAVSIDIEVPVASLEGYLFPETYRFVRDDFEVEDLVQKQVQTFVERFLAPHAEEIKESGRSLHDLVTMASMLEREEPKPTVRPRVAGVLYKRLDAGRALGVDATSRYTLDSWNDRRAFLAKLRDPKDPYNTRLRTGLPPTPLGAPSLESLVAALRPVSSEYWYYLHDAEQQIHFAKTGQEHEANRRRYGVW